MTSEPSRPNPFGALIEAQLQLLSMSNAFLEAAIAKDGLLAKASASEKRTKTETAPSQPQAKPLADPVALPFTPVAFAVTPARLGNGGLCCEIEALDAAGTRVLVDRIVAATVDDIMRALEACDVTRLCRLAPAGRVQDSAGQALLRRARERQLAAKLRSAIEDAQRAILELSAPI